MIPNAKDINKIFFKCEASAQIGVGHVMRCLTLAHDLQLMGYSPVFLCSEASYAAVPALAESGYTACHEQDINQHYGAALVVDHYDLDSAYEKQWRERVKAILVIDDLANRHHNCDLLLDQTYNRDKHDYRGLVPDNAEVLAGANFALLRAEFVENRERSVLRQMREAARNTAHIFISFGGTDPQNLSLKTLALLDATNQRCNVNVVLGACAPYREAVSSYIKEKRNDSYKLHVNVSNIADLMADADFAIGAGGTTSWERCCLGLPAIVVDVADNQLKISQELRSAGAIDYAGYYKDADIMTNLGDGILRMIDDKNYRRTMSRQAANICDGGGANRVSLRLVQAIERADT